jgi:hypothetical protein
MGGLTLICCAHASYAELDPGTTQSAHEPHSDDQKQRSKSKRFLGLKISKRDSRFHLIIIDNLPIADPGESWSNSSMI